MNDSLPVVDAIISFGGGLYPDTELPNHLSIGRTLQLESFLAKVDVKPFVILGGGAINYQTGVVRQESSSVHYGRFLGNEFIEPEKVIMTNKGFCTVTEVLGAQSIIEARGFQKIMYNTSQEHERRVLVMLELVLGEGYLFFRNPFSQPDHGFMNIPREKELTDLFIRHFGHLGKIPYMDDKIFYEQHRAYYDESISIIEHTQQNEGRFDNMAYLGMRK